MPSQHRAYPWIAAVAAIIMLARSASTVKVFNHTVDETFHIAAAVGLYDAHKHVADATHPPVSFLVAGFPLWRIGVHVPSLKGSTTVLGFPQMDKVADQALFDQHQSYWTILTEARMAMLIFPAIALLYLFLLGSWLANDLVAMLAVLFFSTDPSLLGHSGLVNNDVAATAAFLAGLYYGLRWIVTPTAGRAAIAGLVLGLALATKFTMLLLLPSLGLIMLIRPLPALWAAKVNRPLHAYFARWPKMRQFVLAAVVGFFTVWATYLFNVGKIQDQNFFDYTPKWNNIPAAIRNATIPMPSLVIGFIYQVLHSRSGHDSYLNGTIYPKGSLLFFPETLLIKQPIAFTLAWLAAAIAWLRLRERPLWRTAVILIPAAVYFLASITGHIMIGIRHLLPMLPLVYLFACFTLARGRGAILVVALIAMSFIETLVVHPDYIAYANVAAGGPSQLHRYLADSNLDWGQDIARLATWLKTDPRAKGRGYTFRLFDSSLRPLLEQLGLDPQMQEASPHGIFAISRSAQAGYQNFNPDEKGETSRPDYSWLNGYVPIAEIGSTIVVYDLGEAPTTNLAELR